MAGYREVLGTTGVPRVLLSSFVARLPLGMTSLAVLLFAREHGYSFGIAGAALAALGLANAAGAPIQGALVDRFGQLEVLGLAAYGQAAGLLLFTLDPPLHDALLFIALAAAVGALVPPTTACLRALLPAAIPDPRRRERLYSLDAILTELVFATGPLIVAATMAVASSTASLLAMAALSVVGTTAFMTSRLSRSWHPTAAATRAKAGALAISGLRVVFTAIALFGVANGACQVALAALALRLGGAGVAGLLLALWSCGSILGGVVYGTCGWPLSTSRRYSMLLAAVALATSPLLVAGAIPIAAPLAVLAGLFLTPTVACQNSLIGALAPDGLVTEAFTWNTSGIYGGVAVGSGLGGLLIDALGFRGAVLLSVIAACLAALIASRWSHLLVPCLSAPAAEDVPEGRLAT